MDNDVINLQEMILYFQQENLIVEKCKFLTRFYLEFENLSKPPIEDCKSLINNYRSIPEKIFEVRKLEKAKFLSENIIYPIFPEYKRILAVITRKHERKKLLTFIFLNILLFIIIGPFNACLEKFVVDGDYSPKKKCEKLCPKEGLNRGKCYFGWCQCNWPHFGENCSLNTHETFCNNNQTCDDDSQKCDQETGVCIPKTEFWRRIDYDGVYPWHPALRFPQSYYLCGVSVWAEPQKYFFQDSIGIGYIRFITCKGSDWTDQKIVDQQIVMDNQDEIEGKFINWTCPNNSYVNGIEMQKKAEIKYENPGISGIRLKCNGSTEWKTVFEYRNDNCNVFFFFFIPSYLLKRIFKSNVVSEHPEINRLNMRSQDKFKISNEIKL